MFLISKLFKKPQEKPKLPSTKEVILEIIQLVQGFRNRTHTIFYRLLYEGLSDGKNNSIKSAIHELMYYLGKSVSVENEINQKYIRNIFMTQIKRGFFELLTAKWIKEIENLYKLEKKFTDFKRQSFRNPHSRQDPHKKQEVKKMPSKISQAGGSYTFLKNQICLLAQFFWKIGLFIFGPFLQKERETADDRWKMDESFIEFLAHLIVCSDNFTKVHDRFISHEILNKYNRFDEEQCKVFHKKIIEDFQDLLNSELKLPICYKQIFPRSIDLIDNFSKQHRIQKVLKYIVNFPKLIEEEIGKGQEKLLKQILPYTKQSLQTKIQSYLMLLHQENIFFHLKYLDLVMFAVHSDATESGIGELQDYEEKFADYCLYYTSSIIHQNVWNAGIIQLKNAIQAMKVEEGQFQEQLKQTKLGKEQK